MRRAGLARHGYAGDGGAPACAVVHDLAHHRQDLTGDGGRKNPLLPAAHVIIEHEAQRPVDALVGQRQIGLRHLRYRDRKTLAEGGGNQVGLTPLPGRAQNTFAFREL